MKSKAKRIISCIMAIVLVLGGFSGIPMVNAATTTLAYGDYSFMLDDDNNATITAYSGAGGNIVVPSEVDGYEVVAIGRSVFSGYVYDRMSGEKIEDATVSAYWIAYDDTDSFWDNKPKNSEYGTLWNALEYEQANPLKTNEDGKYAWDVPEGWWRVKCEKDGYDTVWSDWMTVPPVQTDVNIGMFKVGEENEEQDPKNPSQEQPSEGFDDSTQDQSSEEQDSPQNDNETDSKNYIPRNLFMSDKLNLTYECNIDDNRMYEVCIEMQNADGEYEKTDCFGGRGWIPENCYNQMPEAFSESGNYRVNIRVGNSDGPDEYSHYYYFNWVKPEQSLSIPLNPRWDTEHYGTGTCDVVDNASAYYYTLYVDGEDCGGGWTYDHDKPDYDFTSFINKYGVGHNYSFKVKALVETPENYAHGQWSAMSGVLKSNTTQHPVESDEPDKSTIPETTSTSDVMNPVVTTEKPTTVVPVEVEKPTEASKVTTNQPTTQMSPSVATVKKDNSTTFNIKNKKSYKTSKKITVKDKDGIKSIKLNKKTIKVKNKKSYSFRLSKYKKYLKKKGKWNKLVVTDKKNKKKTIQFKIK